MAPTRKGVLRRVVLVGIAFVLICATPSFRLAARQMGPMQAGGRGPVIFSPGAGNSPDSQAFDDFKNETFIDKKIQLGEDFDKRFPKSPRRAAVDDQMVYLYYNRHDWPKFYAIADVEIAESPNNLAVLRLTGWVISHLYDNADPSGPKRLSKAEIYEKHALALIAARKKPSKMTDEEFSKEQLDLSSQAHSGLGMIYFRRHEYEKAVPELDAAVKTEAPESALQDLYALGVAFQNLNRSAEAVDSFTKCAQMPGPFQMSCEYGAKNPAEETAFSNFGGEPNPDSQLKLGEAFIRDYPASQHQEVVESLLVNLYNNKADWPNFYGTAAKVLAKDPDNVAVLTLVGWVIPHSYRDSAQDANAKLGDAEQYEKHAIALMEAMQPPGDAPPGDVEAAKAGEMAQAHSGLGMTYFRRGAFADSAREMQLAVNDRPDASQMDVYVLGVDYVKLRRLRDAAGAFARCAKMPGSMQHQCREDADIAIKTAPPKDATAPTEQNASLDTGASVNPTNAANAPPESPQGQNEIASTGTTEPSPVPLSEKIEPAASPGLAATPAADIPPNSIETPPLRVQTIAIPVRVTVRDANGRAIAGLKKTDFKLEQDGKQVEISNFSSVSTKTRGAVPSTSSAPVPPSSAKAGTATPSAPGTPPAPASRFVVLFFDDVHLYFTDMAQTVAAAEKFLAGLGPEDRIAIVTASGKHGVDFTGDRTKLYSALKTLRPEPFAGGTIGPTSTRPCPPPVTYTAAAAIMDDDSEPILAVLGRDFAACSGIVLEDPNAGSAAGAAQARGAAATARAAGEQAIDSIFVGLQRSVRFLSAMPGERTVVLVSPGFMFTGHQAAFADLIGMAVHDRVVIDTLDAKGLMVRGQDGKWDPDRFERFGYGHFEVEQPILEQLADSTGGRFVKNNNDFRGVLGEMALQPEFYYVLTYVPQDIPSDGKYHALKVSLEGHRNYTVQARRGFYAPSKVETPEDAAKREIGDALYSTDDQHDLPVKVETTLTSKDGAQTLDVKAAVDASQLHFVREGGVNHEELTIVAALFDQNGNYLDGTQKLAKMDLDDATLAKLNKTGFYIDLTFDVKPGDYVLRLVSRDSSDQHISAESAPVSVAK